MRNSMSRFSFLTLLVFVTSMVTVIVSDASAQRVKPLNNNRNTVVVQVVGAARDAVVNISTTQVATVRRGFFGGDMFDDIFPMPGMRQNVQVQSLGSGFIIHPDGFVVTNEHVVQRATKISVSLADGSSYDAEVVATDDKRDLAILHLQAPEGKEFTALSLGRSDEIMIGESVIAIGNPKGYAHSVTSGLVSALDRELEFGNSVQYDGLIQTDAAINPGSSGGPLLNVNAEVIGVNSAIRADAQGIGFAIAVDDLVRDLPRLLDIRRIKRIDTGMELAVVADSAGKLTLRAASVHPDGPESGSGLEAGMTITSVKRDEKALNPTDMLIELLGCDGGDEIELSATDGEKNVSVKLALRQIPEPDGNELAMKRMGLSLKPVTPELVSRYRLPISEGLMVNAVWNAGPAKQLGMEPGDVVFQLGSSYVNSLDQVGRVLENVSEGDLVRIGIARGPYRVIRTIKAADLQGP